MSASSSSSATTRSSTYFFTAEPAEAAMLDAGIIVPGWQRTGFAFKVLEAGGPPGERMPLLRYAAARSELALLHDQRRTNARR